MTTTTELLAPEAEPVVTEPTPTKEKKAKAKAVKEEDTNYGLVLYTDGSAQPTNPGFGGWGVHGYIYSHLDPVRGHGNSTQYLTEDGYKDKAGYNKAKQAAASVTGEKFEKPVEVKPLSYVNGFGSFPHHITNNVAEIAACANGMAYAADKGVRRLLIKTDSKYTVQGSQEWLPIWKRNNWIKGDGTPVANQEIWKTLDKNLQTLLDRGVDVEVRWVKGHSVHLGNQIADKNADFGAFYSMRNQLRTEFDTRPADGFWAQKGEKHPFICQKRIYFSSLAQANKPGEYYLGEHGKDDELLGKRTADGCHSVIKLAEPESSIELLRRYQCELANGEDSIIMGRLDKLYEAGTTNDLERYGDICFVRKHKNRLDLDFVDEEPITKELRPPRLAMRALASLSTLDGILESWKAGGDTNLVTTDVTDLFYEKTDKGETRLKAEFVPGYSGLKIDASYGKATETKQDKLELSLGVDLPDRNALKRLEKYNPRVVVVTWMESDKAFRYATILSAGNDHGIWAGMHSNLRVIV